MKCWINQTFPIKKQALSSVDYLYDRNMSICWEKAKNKIMQVCKQILKRVSKQLQRDHN